MATQKAVMNQRVLGSGQGMGTEQVSAGTEDPREAWETRQSD